MLILQILLEIKLRIKTLANLTQMGVKSESIRVNSHAMKDICTFTNPRTCLLEDYIQL